MRESLWFDSYIWLVFIMPFVGLLCAGLSRRRDPVIEGERVLRHDRAARLAHWTHAVSTAMLLLSGIALGARFSPSLSTGSVATAWLFNLHFVFVLVFLFGTFYWLGNTVISRHRLREHLPTRNLVTYTLRHYGHLLGFKRFSTPPESKYFESERAAFILAVLAAAWVLISGLFKVAAHAVSLPGALMNVMTWAHDISAVLMLLFFFAHVFFAAVVPFAWKTLPSMFTGYVALDHARRDHAAWIEQLEKGVDDVQQGA
jgi:formate dehydrogenase subunit gamma